MAVAEKRSLKPMFASVALAQFGTPAPFAVIVSAVQNTSDSGMLPVRLSWFAVLAATVPMLSGVPVAFVVWYVVILV